MPHSLRQGKKNYFKLILWEKNAQNSVTKGLPRKPNLMPLDHIAWYYCKATKIINLLKNKISL